MARWICFQFVEVGTVETAAAGSLPRPSLVNRMEADLSPPAPDEHLGLTLGQASGSVWLNLPPRKSPEAFV